MFYSSTRDKEVKVTSSFAIVNGISKEGGLYIPESLPTVENDFIVALVDVPYHLRAYNILKMFLTDFSDDELLEATNAAYNADHFLENYPAPIVKVNESVYSLELWHGPTCAFKDIALQILPQLMAPAAKRVLDGKKILIIVATSGDTGKAALEGFCDVFGVSIAVFYPNEGVSQMQRLQMASQKGSNVAVYAIDGNFDDAQGQVKAIFTNQNVAKQMELNNIILSSGNSINWGRLAPQIVYYFSAYADMIKTSQIKTGDKINFVVPTGNFGNILAGYYALKMGLPINRLICASNKNNILTDFINTGVYDANREFHTTISPSMDILISSNLERLLSHLTDDTTVNDLMGDLFKHKRYKISDQLKVAIAGVFNGYYVDEDQCANVIKEYQVKYNYLLDTHTAVAAGAYEEYVRETGDMTKTILVSTASPYKFAGDVLTALGGEVSQNDFATAEKLSVLTNTVIPKAINDLKTAHIRFTKTISPDDMESEVIKLAKGE